MRKPLHASLAARLKEAEARALEADKLDKAKRRFRELYVAELTMVEDSDLATRTRTHSSQRDTLTG